MKQHLSLFNQVRIHVEQVIGLLQQKYTILESNLPRNMIMYDNSENNKIVKIVTVCCGLCNCCESVIPFE